MSGRNIRPLISCPFCAFPRVGHGVGQAVAPHFDPRLKVHFYSKKASKTEVFDAFWSCWADSNRRPHPYQKAVDAFTAYPFIPRRTAKPLCCKGLAVLLVLMCFNTYREALRRFGVFVGRIVGKMPCVRRKAATQEKSRFECATLATGMSTSPLKWECSFASTLSHKQEYLRICSLPLQRCSYQPQPWRSDG